MFWMKKVAAVCTAAALVAGGLFAGLAARSGGTARATVPLPAEPQAPAEVPDAAAKRFEKQIAELEKLVAEYKRTEEAFRAEMEQLDAAKRAKAAAKLGNAVSVVVSAGGGGKPAEYAVREVVAGKVAEVRCSDPDILATYLTRARNDPNGPKALRVSAETGVSLAVVNRVFAAGAAAGYKAASFSRVQGSPAAERALWEARMRRQGFLPPGRDTDLGEQVEERPEPGEVDLSKFAPKKP